MISINESIVNDLFTHFKVDIDQIISETLANVMDFRTTPNRSGGKGKPPIAMSLTKAEIAYLDYLILHFSDIVLASPNKMSTFKTDFDKFITGANMFKLHKTFKNELIIRLGYVKRRNDFFPNYFSKTEIKACGYCNSQLAVTVRTILGEKSAKFQVDHFLPKSQYPCFSISFFNLIPVCGPCNGKKSANSVNFRYYSNLPLDLKESLFNFELDRRSIIKYRINGNLDELEVKFDDGQGGAFNSNFDIEGIYNTQKDLAEELVLKSIMYNKSYLEGLKKSFKKLYPHKIPMAERLLVGNYTREKDIHKRPMSKFTMDISRQLGLID